MNLSFTVVDVYREIELIFYCYWCVSQNWTYILQFLKCITKLNLSFKVFDMYHEIELIFYSYWCVSQSWAYLLQFFYMYHENEFIFYSYWCVSRVVWSLSSTCRELPKIEKWTGRSTSQFCHCNYCSCVTVCKVLFVEFCL